MIDASIAHGIMSKDPMHLTCRDVGPDATTINGLPSRARRPGQSPQALK
jgi:hypothetical protein